MPDRAIEVLRHKVTELSELANTLGFEPSDTEVVVTVVCGEVSGEVERVVSRDEDGGLKSIYRARIDGLGETMGVASVEFDSVAEIRCLAVERGSPI